MILFPILLIAVLFIVNVSKQENVFSGFFFSLVLGNGHFDYFCLPYFG